MIKINDELTAKITHLRTVSKDGRVYMSPRKYEGEKVINKKPCITIAEILDKNLNVVSEGVARCSSGDMFNRKRGREIAIRRAMMFLEGKKAVDENKNFGE